MAHHYRTIEALHAFLGPYNARQRNSNRPYLPPDKETLKQLVKQGGMNDFSYQALINGVIRFCEHTKGRRGLPEPHPSTIHSIQLPQPAFELTNGSPGCTMVNIAGAEEPIEVQAITGDFRFIIVRPKLSQLGTASATNWEVLFFRHPHGYIPDWADSTLNPRWSGKF
jgi:hypothetical protein